MDAQYYSGWGHLGLRGGRGETLAQQYAMGGGVARFARGFVELQTGYCLWGGLLQLC